MRIWHEKLIPILCQKHLCAMWREGLGAYKIIIEDKQGGGYKNHPAVKEFLYVPISLHKRLEMVRHEMLSRGYHPKPLPAAPIKITKTYSISFDKYGVVRKEELGVQQWQTLEEQINILKSKPCICKSNLLLFDM